MSYIDGFVAAVPEDKRDAFIAHAEACWEVLKECGAQKVVDCWEDDVPDGEITSFPMAVKREPGEAIVFSWIVWPSREVRDAGMAKMMEDPRMKPDVNPMPFDGKRLIFGGFTPVAEF